MKKLFIIFVLLLAMGAAYAQGSDEKAKVNELREFAWMEGAWKGMAGNSSFYESFEMVNDTLIRIDYYADSSLTKVEGSGSVLLEKGDVYHTYGQSKWKLSERSGNTWCFEPVENASNYFCWTFIDHDSWSARLVSSGKVSNYQMERIR